MSEIHPTAIIAPGAVLGEGCSVGPYSVIGPHVTMGKDNRIFSHAVVEGHTRLGDGNTIFQFASVGAAPQDLKYKGEPSLLEIGNSNIIREYATLQPGTEGGGMLTSIGDGNLFMANCHVGHDSRIGSRCILANSTALSGHVTLGDYVTLGGLCGIHQFVRLGDHCMLGAGSMVNKDVPPFCMGQGDRAELVGINRIGLQRRGFSAEDVAALRRLYREIFWGSGTFTGRLEAASREYADLVPAANMLRFMRDSQRGITPARARARSGEDEN